MLWARNALSFKLRRLSGEVMESRRAVWWCAVVLSVLRVSERDGPKFSPFPIYSVAGGERKPGVGGGGGGDSWLLRPDLVSLVPRVSFSAWLVCFRASFDVTQCRVIVALSFSGRGRL